MNVNFSFKMTAVINLMYALLGTIAIFAVPALLGIQFDSYESTINALLGGTLFNLPATDMHTIACIDIVKIFNFFYQKIPQYGWYYIIIISLLFLSYCDLLFQIITDNRINVYVKITAILLIAFPLWETLSLFSNTRFTFLGLAITGINLIYHRGAVRSLITIPRLALFTFFFLLRPESSQGFVIIIVAGIVILKPLIRVSYSKIMLLLAICCLLYLRIQIKGNENPFLKNINHDIYLLTTSGYGVPVLDTSIKAKTISEAIQQNFINDREVISLEVLDTHAALRFKELSQKQIFLDNLHKGWSRFCYSAISCSYFCIAYLLFVSIILYSLTPFNSRRYIFVIIFNLFIFLLLFSLGALVHMEPRVFSPIIFVACVFQLFGLKTNLNSVIKKPFSIICIALIALLLTLRAGQIKQSATSLHQSQIAADRFLEKLDESYNNKFFVLDINTMNLFGRNVLHFNRLKNNMAVGVDMSTLPMIASFKQDLDKWCSCDSEKAKQLYSFIKQTSSQMVYISSDSRVEFITRYFSVVHGLDIRFSKIGTIDSGDTEIDGVNVSCYQIQ